MYTTRVRKDILSLPLKIGWPSPGDIVHPRGRGWKGPILKGHTYPGKGECVYTEEGISSKDFEYDHTTDA